METKLQIYLVDDSQDMIQKMKDGLRSSKLFEVIGSALNGEQCLHELHAHTIDISCSISSCQRWMGWRCWPA